ncbi:hypothetical protein [Ruminococcus sp. YE78]|uniref:hypothetical protein n=1 Tax=Ruminococcus sp. YE78 TaxID=1352374 RepID=UPI00088E59F2|nr:hypothetical protein [Ruminococcus sp. YE78]SDA28095.1 hypothetical protein SAMN02910446_02914 [Ruminococcus sp. YE78]
MNNKPKKISEIITEKGAQAFLDGYTDFGTDAALTDDEQQRILSSAMRKAGFEMKDTMTTTKTRKHSKRFIAFVAAAALMTTGAVGVGAYYAVNSGMWNGMRSMFGMYTTETAPESIDESRAAALESITSHDGKQIENTFNGIDVTYEGTAGASSYENHISSSCIVFTLRKTDGTAFTVPPEGWHYTLLYSEGEYQRYEYVPLKKTTLALSSSNVLYNDDGSLSVTLFGLGYEIREAAQEKVRPLRIGFGSLYLEPDRVFDETGYADENNETNAKLNNMIDLSMKTDEAYSELCINSSYREEVPVDNGFVYYKWSDDPLKEDNEYVGKYRELYTELQKAHDEIASESYEGSVLFDIDLSKLDMNAAVFTAEYKDSTINVSVTPLHITVSGVGKRDFKQGLFDDDNYPKLTIHYKDGRTDSYISTGAGTGGSGKDKTWDIFYEDNQPFDVDNIEYIKFDGVKIEVK